MSFSWLVIWHSSLDTTQQPYIRVTCLEPQPCSNGHPGRQQVNGSMNWALLPTWETQHEFLPLSFSLTQPWVLWAFREWTGTQKLSIPLPPLPLYLLNKLKTKLENIFQLNTIVIMEALHRSQLEMGPGRMPMAGAVNIGDRVNLRQKDLESSSLKSNRVW